MEKFTFTAFRAIDSYEGCQRFHRGHSQILEDLGIQNITSNYPTWFEDPGVIVILAEDMDKNLVGGIRVHRYHGNGELPVIQAVEDQDAKIHDVLNQQFERGTAESCGLWNAKRVFGRGLSPLLARASVSLSNSLDVQTLFCFSAPYTFKMISSLGFLPVSTVGNNGTFPYPSEKFLSTVLWIPDYGKFEHADLHQRERILSLIQSPDQTTIETSQGKEVEIAYNLSWKKP